jgi:hypothetical protein
VAKGSDDGTGTRSLTLGSGGRAASTQDPPETTREAAQALRVWATTHNLLRRGTAPVPAVGQVPPISFSTEALSVLERQAITAIGINERRRKIYVYTNKKVTKSQSLVLPDNFNEAVDIEYRQARPMVINNEEEDPILAAVPYYVRAGRYACGSSIGVANDRMAGTLGALVSNNLGELFGLTNNHVTGGCNNTRLGLPILAPGVMDVMENARHPFTIGFHHSVLTMRQGDPAAVNHRENTDAALLRIVDDSAVSSMQGEVYDTPGECIDLEDDMEVEKVGRTTGHQLGIIDGEIIGEWPVTYKSTTWHSPDEQVTFVGTVYFEPVFTILGRNGPFAQPGDSGSLVTTVKDGMRRAVGLIFAGRGSEAYMLPLRPILKGFAVSLVSEHGTQ